MTEIAKTLSDTTLGPPASHRNLRVFPLLRPHAPPPDYLTLDEALEAGLARVTEVSEGGSVPELRFVNGAEKPVLLVDGEELVGAKQNRTLNVTVLVGPKQTVVIPVTCVEQGRWSYRSAEFRTARRAHFARARAAKAAHVSESLRTRGDRRADQGLVWEQIAAKAARLGAHSPTGAMDEIYERHRGTVEEYERALPAVAGQAGAVFAIGRHVVGLDLFDAPETLRALWPKILSSYAVDAIDWPDENPGREDEVARAVEGFLGAVAESPVDRFPSLGLGEDLRLRAPGLAGGALWALGRVVHLGAFALEAVSHEPGHPRRRGGMARASRRRQGRSAAR